MVLLANGGADVSRPGGFGGGSRPRDRVGTDVGGRCLRTHYNRNIRRAAVVVGQRSVVYSSRSARGIFLSRSERSTLRLLLQLRPRIKLNLWLAPGGGSIPLQALRHDDALIFAVVHEDFPPRFDLRGPFCDKAHSSIRLAL